MNDPSDFTYATTQTRPSALIRPALFPAMLACLVFALPVADALAAGGIRGTANHVERQPRPAARSSMERLRRAESHVRSLKKLERGQQHFKRNVRLLSEAHVVTQEVKLKTTELALELKQLEHRFKIKIPRSERSKEPALRRNLIAKVQSLGAALKTLRAQLDSTLAMLPHDQASSETPIAQSSEFLARSLFEGNPKDMTPEALEEADNWLALGRAELGMIETLIDAAASEQSDAQDAFEVLIDRASKLLREQRS